MSAGDLKLEIVPAKPHHCGRILRRLRREHAQAFALVGMNAHKELRGTLANSYYARSAFLNGELVGMWGVAGGLLSPTGVGWLCLTNAATAYPRLILREGRKELANIMRDKVELVATVLRDDRAAMRFLAHLGFHCGHQGMGAPAHNARARANLMKFAHESLDHRVPAGGSYAIWMGYHNDSMEAH